MASLTVRQLDEKLKKQLRLRAAQERPLGRGRGPHHPAQRRGRRATRSCRRASERQARRERKRRQPTPRRILLIIGGGIAAYKSLDLIRRLRERGIAVRVVMTEAAQKFITPLSVGALAGEHAFTDLFDAASEFDVGHIRLARDADLIVVAPATADLMAKMANGHADDLATAVLLATDKTDPARAGDEPAHVEQQGDAAQSRAARRRRRRARRPERRRDGGERRGRHRPHGRAARDRRGRRGAARGQFRACSPAFACSSRRARRMSRSTRCATSPTARPASRATPSPKPRPTAGAEGHAGVRAGERCPIRAA